jgi:hypothetical protein
MDRITAADEAFHLRGYYAAKRHTIQVDFAHYVADLKKEIAKGERRARALGYALPITPVAGGTPVSSLAA